MHFRILLGMEMEDRCNFFLAYVPNRLTQLGLGDLTKKIEDFLSSHRWATLSLMPIPRKKSGPEFEAFLAKSPHSKLVAHCLHFSTEEYQILVSQIKHLIPWYLNIHRGFDEQNPRQVKALLAKILDDYPVFKKYEEAWPIPVIVTRLLRNLETGDTPDSTMSTECDLRSSQSNRYIQREPFELQHQHRCPLLWKYHDHSGRRNVSPKANTLLSFLKMEEELAPVLHFLGVQTDTQFDALKKMEPEEKVQLLEGPEELQLNAFQRRVLDMIIEKY
ncbi:hypothetical protein B0H13DRAFT_2374982 [Mycena leptocephala]|nr:hypothetical protein B0H13DRAFT_2374982 [Mycena leptocephala]